MSETTNELVAHIPEVSFQKLKLLSGKSIGIRKWLMKEEKEFLFSIETQMDNQELLINECLSLSRKCVDNVNLFDNLSKNDLLFLISKQRTLSKGEEIEFTYRCYHEDCDDQAKTELEEMLDLKTDVKLEHFNFEPIEINEYKFHLKDVSYSKIRLMDKNYLSDEENPELFKLNNEFILNSIDVLEINETKHENLNLDYLDEFLGTLSHDDYAFLSNEIGAKISNFSLDKKVSCPVCGNENIVAYEEIFSLMVF